MSLWLDIKYIKLVSPHLELFRAKSEYLFSCRCPLCGDSAKTKTKTRGYFYRKKDFMVYHCHNCNEGYIIPNFLKLIKPDLYSSYNMELFEEKNPKKKNIFIFPKVSFDSEKSLSNQQEKVIQRLPAIDSLAYEHYAYRYIRSRHINSDYYKHIRYASCFATLVDEFIPGHEKKFPKGEPRLIFPYYDRDNNILGLQGRALKQSELKYITIKANDDAIKAYGLDRIKPAETVYVTEGPIDSFFFDNGVASMDSKLDRINQYIPIDTDRVYLYDNEPRNSQIAYNLQKTIDKNLKVFIWPEKIKAKDINEWYDLCLDKDEIKRIVDNNTFVGLRAKLEFSKWKK